MGAELGHIDHAGLPSASGSASSNVVRWAKSCARRSASSSVSTRDRLAPPFIGSSRVGSNEPSGHVRVCAAG